MLLSDHILNNTVAEHVEGHFTVGGPLVYFWIAYRVENTAMILEQVVAVTEKYDINSKFMVRFDD